MASPIRIAVLANASQAKRELNGVAGTAEKISGKFSKFRVPAALALGGIALGAKKAIDAASDLNEETSKSQVIFGKNAGAINKWASTADTALGQSKRQALEAASGFGIIGQKAGLSGAETAKFAKQFTGLSSDLASFNNTSPEEAITAISAAMRGESEPIRKYGVLLDDATLRARALKLGLISNIKQALTPQQKALAASKEILAQTGKAQGDFARTSNGAANKSRILAAQQENLKAKLGKGLLPAYQAVLGITSKFAGVIGKHPQLVQAVVVAIAALAAVVLAASAAQKVYTAGVVIYNGVSKTIAAATIVWRNAQLALNIAMALNPVGLIVVAIVALIAIIVLVVSKNDWLRGKLIAGWNKIKGAAKAIWDWISSKIKAAWGLVMKVLQFSNPVIFVIRHWTQIKALTGAAWNWVRTKTVAAWQAVVGTIRDKIAAALAWVRGMKDRIVNFFKNAGGWLIGAGKHIIQGLIDGISAMFGKVKDKLGDLTGKLTSWKGPPKRDARLLKPAGESIIQGLVDGIDARTPTVRRTLQALSRDISSFTASPTATVKLDASDAYVQGASTSQSFDFNLRLTAQQLSQLQRGAAYKADLDAYEKALRGRRT